MTKTNQQRAQESKEWRDRKKAQGLCNSCGTRPPRKDGPTCEACFKKRGAQYLKIKKEGRHLWYYRKARGLCTGCGEPLQDKGKYNGKPVATCPKCREKSRARRADLRLARYKHILVRDGYVCKICNRTRRLCVHHIDGNGESKNGVLQPSKMRNDEPDNLITLCQYCHYAVTCLRQSIANRNFAVELILA